MGYDRCVEQQFGEVRGICESQVGRDRLQFVNQVHKDFNTGSQVQDASDLLFRFECLADSLILPSSSGCAHTQVQNTLACRLTKHQRPRHSPSDTENAKCC